MANTTWSSEKIRQCFLKYFADHQHTVVPSSSLIPAGDPTLLFTNAGMVQFKDCFLGKEKRSYARAVSCQKCMRASGKHNDLENVGYTSRHHTFFEMLGNFSFGDYFKKEAIFYAWDFLTNILQIPPEKLWVTVHEKDEEAAQFWREAWQKSGKKGQGLSYLSDKDNFWAMGEIGPCGPCSEIYFDHGEQFSGDEPGGINEGERYVEIWNLVFMQYERDEKGKLSPLPRPSVDTGMGLERVAAVMQGVHDNYDNDIFSALIARERDCWGLKNTKDKQQNISLRVIADHIRSISFLIAEGITPSNEGRGYVLRRIIRRALRHLGKLPAPRNASLSVLVEDLAEIMASYDELTKSVGLIVAVIRREETAFSQTLEQGLKIFAEEVGRLKNKIIPGEIAFRLYDTYGFPLDLTEDLAREHGLQVAKEGFIAAMNEQRERAQKASKFAAGKSLLLPLDDCPATEFVGYEKTNASGKIVALFKDGDKLNFIDDVDENSEAILVLDKTPFYAESGGQVADRGEINSEGSIFLVNDVKKQGNIFLHYGEIKSGVLKTGDKVCAAIDVERREAITLNHTAAHLLHVSLRKVLGEHVFQKGSLVDDKKLRFDFGHFAAVTAEELAKVEDIVNTAIRQNLLVKTQIKSLDEAKNEQAMALFEEKYGDEVRIVTVGDEKPFSKELCGGTHVKATGQIGFVKIVEEIGIAAGVRRIEALTGENALMWVRNLNQEFASAKEIITAASANFLTKLRQLVTDERQAQKDIIRLKSLLVQSKLNRLIASAKEIAGIKVLVTEIDGADAAILRENVERFKKEFALIIVLATIVESKVQMIVGVSEQLVAKIKAGDVAKQLSLQLGGNGGGKPDLAQGGGHQVALLPEVLKNAFAIIEQKIS